MNDRFFNNFSVLILLFDCAAGLAGPIIAGSAVTLCYTICNTGFAACMAGSEMVAGTTGPVGLYVWAAGAAAGCSIVQGACRAVYTTCGLATDVASSP